jgi:hypothetical protein
MKVEESLFRNESDQITIWTLLGNEELLAQ